MITLSDIVISAPIPYRHGSPPAYPLTASSLYDRFTERSPIVATHGPTQAAQKTVLFGSNNLALWAGSQLVARVILREMDFIHRSGRRVDISGIIARCDLTDTEEASVSLIAYFDEGCEVRRQALNEQTLDLEQARILYAGTGSYPAIEDFKNQLEGANIEAFWSVFFSRMGSMILGDITSDENEIFNFGGWFEIAEWRNGFFFKIPYAVKTWYVDGDNVAEGPTYVSGDSERSLSVCLLDHRNGHSLKRFVIPDFLAYPAVALAEPFIPEHPHELEFHVVHIKQAGQTVVSTLQPPQLSISFRFEGPFCESSVDPAFLKFLVTRHGSGSLPHHMIVRRSEWKG